MSGVAFIAVLGKQGAKPVRPVLPIGGPMYGAQAVSEHGLAEKAMAHLPAGATVLGDHTSASSGLPTPPNNEGWE